MSIIDTLMSVLAPYECLGCKTEGGLLCGVCAGGLSAAPERCYRCQTASPAGRTCGVCSAASVLGRVRAVSPYAGMAKELVAMLKFSGARTASREMAVLMAPLLEAMSDPDVLVVPVPTATGRVRRRGYDQARLLARELCRRTGLPRLDCLARSGQTHQVGAGRERRHEQLQRAFHTRRPGAVQGRHILLVDDVVTTGATLEAAALVLHDAGAARIEAITFCAA